MTDDQDEIWFLNDIQQDAASMPVVTLGQLLREAEERGARKMQEEAANACGKPNGPWQASPSNCREKILSLNPVKIVGKSE